MKLVLILLGVAVGVFLLYAEGYRQRRKLEREEGFKARGTSGMLASGTLELQRILQPDRATEELQAEIVEEDRVNPGYNKGIAGDADRD